MGILDGTAGLVTAAGSGIGRASAQALAAAGAAVVVSDVDDAAGEATVALIEAAGGTASYLHANVADEDEVAALVAATVQRYGRLDWAHNNAALGAAPSPVADQRRDRWERSLAVTLTGTMLCLKHEIRQLLAQGGGGSIVNTASAAGLSGLANQSAYAAGKWGVVGLTKSAALEVAGAGIRVNALCPGMTATAATLQWAEQDPGAFEAMTAAIPMGRPALPEDQAAAVVWLCSEQSRYVTGIVLPVDGGLTAG
jgi:NAD(P)-dependent dehydrogenase (short-subunit alcohol dehydrogenase family)